MKKIIIIAGIALLAACSGVKTSVETEENAAFVQQLQPRDSILIADQLRYGASLGLLPEGAMVELPPLRDTLTAYVDIVRPWQLDTLAYHKKSAQSQIEASMVVTSFDEGEYVLPGFQVAVHMPDGSVDTLSFKGADVLFCTMPVDTATFKIHDIKGQVRYPVTFREILPWLILALAVAGAAAGAVLLYRRYRRRREELSHMDPPHIVALRKLDAYRGSQHWAEPRQKAFYSGVTDALREYISARYGVSAMEMTTAEMFAALKGSDMPEDLKKDLMVLFERSDYVKFAKYVASDEENAAVLPLGVRFVTSTYQEEIKEENANVL